MSKEQDQNNARAARAREVGLFRYALISEALNEELTTKQRGRLVRAVAAKTHVGPFGTPVRISRATLDRWIRDYRTGGFAALVPTPRRVAPCTPPQVLELAVALKTEAPDRTAAQVAVVLAAHGGFAPSARTLQRHFAAAGLTRIRPDGAPLVVFGRFEAERPNVRWVGDALHGPHIAGRKAILIAFLDDHSRAVVAARWGYAENAVALRETLKLALAARGRPAQIYVDNGACFIDSGLRRACAVLGIKLTHSRPGMPAGRGKIERFFKTVRDQFLVEISDGPDDVSPAGTSVGSLAELNSLFTAWVEQVYHQRVHTETEMAPLARFLAAGPPVPIPADLLVEAFRWGEWRTVTKTALVSLQGNQYEVDPALAGSKVELVFDPFDLTDIDVRHHGRLVGKAVPFRIGRHVHPKAAADAPPPATPTGIDYLRLIQTRHTRALGQRLHYAQLTDPTPVTSPTDQTAMTPVEPPADTSGLDYDTDLLALASGTEPDPDLEAELADLAALRDIQHTHTADPRDLEATP
ncbi:MAG TPA: DDE-type integrase/transposase/recombinase [Thermomicrobiaceae bacterium]|nr:DDE-type integrase/transposase/recombinase [Thermomicrobiaceae bacterium]